LSNRLIKCLKRQIREEIVMNKDLAIGIGVGLLAGVVIGGVVALLFAPQSGKETRQMIKDKATDAVDTVKEKSGGVMELIKILAAAAGQKA
jgi:gas vesicle protein